MNKMRKVGFNGKIAMVMALAVIVFTVLISVFTVGLDFKRIDWVDWAGKMAINVCLCLVMMFTGETAYMSYVTAKENGKYQFALEKYNEALEGITGRTNYLGQYLHAEHKKAITIEKISYLLDHGVENPNAVLKLGIDDVPHLSNPYAKEIDGKTYKFKAMSKRQQDAVKTVLDGGITVKRVPKSFYLIRDGKEDASSDYAIAAKISTDRRIAVVSGRFFKVISMVFTSALMVALTVNDFIKGDDIQAWFNLLSRVLACIGGFFAGCRNSSKANDIDCRALAIKTTMLNEYRVFIDTNPGHFRLTDEEWEADEEYREYEGKQAIAEEGGKEHGGEETQG